MTTQEATNLIQLWRVSIEMNGADSEHLEAFDMAIEALSAQPEIIQCKDCYWWEKQEASMQGRCDRYGFYPTGYWYCAGARERRTDG